MSGPVHSSHTLRELAVILEEAAEAVEMLGEDLCGDLDLMQQHMSSLQGLDLISQTVRQISVILCEGGTPNGFDHVRLESLRHRLEEADQRHRAAA